MRILVLNAGRFSSLDGGAVRCRELVVKAGHDVTWVDPVTSKNYYKTEEVVHGVPKNVEWVPGRYVKANPLGEWWAREKHFLSAAKKFDGDVAVFYNAWGTWRARRHLQEKGVPVVFDYIDLMHAFRSNAVERAVSRKATVQALRQSDAVVATATDLVRDAKPFNDCVALVPNGVDTAFYASAKPFKTKKPCVGFVGGFGPWLDVAAVALAAKENPQVQFHVIGDGLQRKTLESVAKKQSNVTVSDGFVAPGRARRWMASFDVGLIPFKQNALTDAVCPLKLFEYWATQTAVIAAPNKEVKHVAGDAAYWAKTPGELADAVRKVTHNASKRRALVQAGSKKVAAYDWKTLRKKFLAVLEDVAA
ncbi:glycosyltransferase family 4 protein [Candidatus Micrarchaeota archaeon]|nr:glycosyltransferase family 4 protein [Candidatus Micrarchaeota archaeon]